jgi:hypothetical protein
MIPAKPRDAAPLSFARLKIARRAEFIRETLLDLGIAPDALDGIADASFAEAYARIKNGAL